MKHEVEIYPANEDGKIWARVVYAIALTPDGQEPERNADGNVAAELVTVMAPIAGPQSWQSIRTYGLKYFLRGKLLLKTGERDLDNEQKAPPPDTAAAPQPTGRWELGEDKTYTMAEPFDDPVDAQRALFQLLKKDIQEGAAPDWVAIYEANLDHIENLPEKGCAFLKAKADERASADAEASK